jgi:hypothetical protein
VPACYTKVGTLSAHLSGHFGCQVKLKNLDPATHPSPSKGSQDKGFCHGSWEVSSLLNLFLLLPDQTCYPRHFSWLTESCLRLPRAWRMEVLGQMPPRPRALHLGLCVARQDIARESPARSHQKSRYVPGGIFHVFLSFPPKTEFLSCSGLFRLVSHKTPLHLP